jgi:zinc/manganese transport system permease protein
MGALAPTPLPTGAVAAALFAPGFFSSPVVQHALQLGAAAAIVSAVVGCFVVSRGQSFAGHALGDIGSSGGSGAYLVGLAPLWGFVAISLAAAAAMELIGIQRARGRDVATGVVLGAGFGLAALLLYLASTAASATNAVQTVLFGSIFTVGGQVLKPSLVLAATALALVAVVGRPLWLSSLSAELAAVRGVPVRLIGTLYLAAVALAVALAAITIGAILATALLVGPAATATAHARGPGRAIALAGALGLLATWAGVLLAYDSYYWPPLHHGWPVSFFVVALVVAFHLGGRLLASGGGARRSALRRRLLAAAAGAPRRALRRPPRAR